MFNQSAPELVASKNTSGLETVCPPIIDNVGNI